MRRVPLRLSKSSSTFGVPLDCYDAIVTSGVAARDDLAARAETAARFAMFHLGPERDRGVFEGLPIDCVEPRQGNVVLCTGPYNDDNETPDDYRELLTSCSGAD